MAFSKIYFMSRIPEATELTHAERTTLSAIAAATDISGRNARISQAKLAEKCGHKNIRTVKRHTKKLLDTGWIIQVSRGDSFTNTCSVYRLKGTEQGDEKTPSRAARTRKSPDTPETPSTSKPITDRICVYCKQPVAEAEAYKFHFGDAWAHQACFDKY